MYAAGRGRDSHRARVLGDYALIRAGRSMSDKLPRVNAQELIQVLKRVGFEERGQRGSHLHLRREADNKRLTVPVHKGRAIAVGTLRAILRDADISIERFRELL